MFLVLLLYDCKAASKIDWKLDEDEEAMGKTTVMSRMMSGGSRASESTHLAPTTPVTISRN